MKITKTVVNTKVYKRTYPCLLVHNGNTSDATINDTWKDAIIYAISITKGVVLVNNGKLTTATMADLINNGAGVNFDSAVWDDFFGVININTRLVTDDPQPESNGERRLDPQL
jgi:hypothetical protein